MLAGRSRVITNIIGNSKEVLVGFLSGMEGANAIADFLFGDVNPNGKLQITYHGFSNGITLYDY